MNKREITYLGKPFKEYDKSEAVKDFFESLKVIINDSAKNKSAKENEIKDLFRTKFAPIKNDIQNKVKRLVNETQIAQKNIANGNVNSEMLEIAQSLNAYTNQLLTHYENSYFKIANQNERKKMIRDLRFLLSTYGMVQQSLGNIVYGNQKINESNIRNSVSNKSSLMTSYEKSLKSNKSTSKIISTLPDTSSLVTSTNKSSITEATQKSKLIINSVPEENLLNNSNNCYRNSVIHLLLTLLHNEDFSKNSFKNENLNKAFNISISNFETPKRNLITFLKDYVKNKPTHKQNILNTYNPLLTLISNFSKDDSNYFVIDDYRFKLNINGINISDFQELYTYYPSLNENIKSSNDFYEAFKNNLMHSVQIEQPQNKRIRAEIYFDKMINSIYKSYGNAQMYLYDLLHNDSIFSTEFLDKLKTNNNTYLTTLYYPTSTIIFSLNALITNLQTNLQQQNMTKNKYILFSVGDLHSFKDYDFDKLYLINGNYYQLSDIVYASNGHYISLNMRNGIWYKYDDMTNVLPLSGANANKFNLESSGFYPNIFLLINTGISPPTKTAGGAKKKVIKTKVISKKKKVKSNKKKVKK